MNCLLFIKLLYALMIRTYNPDLIIKVKADCCAGVTPETHDAALKTMQMCQIDVI